MRAEGERGEEEGKQLKLKVKGEELVSRHVCGSETEPYFLLHSPSILQVLCLLISPAEELKLTL